MEADERPASRASAPPPEVTLEGLPDAVPLSRAEEMQPVDDKPAAEASSWDALTQQVMDQARRSGMWRVAVQVLLLVLAVLLSLRLVFDEVLPRILFAAMLSLTVLGVAALIAQAVAESRRQRALLVALAHVTRLARGDPALAARLLPQVEALVAAMRAPSRLWPWSGEPEGDRMLSALAKHASSSLRVKLAGVGRKGLRSPE